MHLHFIFCLFLILLSFQLIECKGGGSGRNPKPCQDRVSTCGRARNLCQNNRLRATLKSNCRKTCGYCTPGNPPKKTCRDHSNTCRYWIKNGYCTSPYYTKKTKKNTCAKSCNLCK